MDTYPESATAFGPVRRFVTPSPAPLANTLGELRGRIDALDEEIVALMAERALCVRDATRFKRHALDVLAPQRQAAVFAHVRRLAEAYEADFPGLANIVEATFRTLVAGCIAGEERFFHDTELIQP